MLINEIVDFCDKIYKAYNDECGRKKCNHPSNKCSGGCYNCLYQIHFPSRFSEEKKELYDCPKMMYHYVCQYTYIYASEILYALNSCTDYLKGYTHYNMMSIGCGGCPDLMALEKFCLQNGISAKISYKGYDINPLWKPIHSKVESYCDSKNINRRLMCEDAFEYFTKYYVEDTNIIVISYLVSYLYNSNQISQINKFFNELVDSVVLRKKTGEKLLIIINDVNSNKRGRYYFSHLGKIIKKYQFTVNGTFKYFDNGNLNYYQKIGLPYSSTNCLFSTNTKIREDYHCSDNNCRSIQLILEVK